jgi:hypothetical protein
MTGWGQERHFRHLRKESGLSPTPDITSGSIPQRCSASAGRQPRSVWVCLLMEPKQLCCVDEIVTSLDIGLQLFRVRHGRAVAFVLCGTSTERGAVSPQSAARSGLCAVPNRDDCGPLRAGTRGRIANGHLPLHHMRPAGPPQDQIRTTPHGRLMLTVLGGLAEFERQPGRQPEGKTCRWEATGCCAK